MSAAMIDKERLLIVDDSQINLEVLVALLGDDYDLRVAIDGVSALQLLATGYLPDLILLDIMMPGQDGYTICRKIKADGRFRDIPVIFLTALDNVADEEQGLAIGAVDYITKPFNPGIVKQRVNTHLELKRHRDQLQMLVKERTVQLKAMTEEALEKEAHLRSVLKSAPAGIGMTVSGCFQWVNAQMEELVGYRNAELVGRGYRMLFPSDAEFERVGESQYVQMNRSGTGTIDTRFRTKDGREIDVVVRSTQLIADDASAGVIFAVLDMTERKRAERALEQSEERFRDIAESLADWIWETDDQGRYTYVSEQVEEILGYPGRDILGKTPFELMAPRQQGKEQNLFAEKMTKREPFRKLLHLSLRKDGRPVAMLSSGKPIFDQDGLFAGYRGVDTDITEQRRLEEDARRANRLAALGELAAGVAHEINNPNALTLYNSEMLGAIFTDLLPAQKEAGAAFAERLFGGLSHDELCDELPALFSGIQDSARRIKRIVDELRDFSRKENALEEEAFDLNQMILSVVSLVTSSIQKATDHFDLSLGEKLPPITGVKGRLEQVLINLLINACQALNDTSQRISLTSSYLPEADCFKIIVVDQGEGMGPDILEHLLEPFVTTKRERGGTGLGLSVSARIVKEHSGQLKFDSEPGKGTTVTLILPASKEV